MAEAGVLGGDLAPQIPAAAFLQIKLEGGNGGLAANGGVFDTAAVGDEHQVVLGQVNALFVAVAQSINAGGLLFAVGAVKGNVGHLDAVMELHAIAFQVLDHGQDHGFILVVAGKAQGGEIRQAADVVDVALKVALHLQGAVPVLKGKHGAPVQPEVGVQDFVIKKVGDLFIVQLLVRGHEQLQNLHSTLVRQAELAIGVGILAAVDGGAAQAVVGIVLVQPVILVQHGDVLILNGGDGAEQIPHALEVVVHLTAAAHNVTDVLVLVAIAGTTGDGVLFQHMDVLALHLAVTHHKACSGQRGQAAADKVGTLVVNALRFFGTGKSFIVTAGIIHKKASLRWFYCLLLFVWGVPFGMSIV